MVPPADRHDPTAASILDFRVKLGNRCMVLPVYALQRASILDFRVKLGNRCKVLPVYPLFRASILDFKPRLGNRCKVLPVYPLLRASILDFKPRLGNRCSIVEGRRQGQDAPPLRNRCYMLLLIPCRHITPSASDTLLRDSVYLKWIYCWRDLGVPRQAPALPNLQVLSRYKEQ